jgi:hypothetical protein
LAYRSPARVIALDDAIDCRQRPRLQCGGAEPVFWRDQSEHQSRSIGSSCAYMASKAPDTIMKGKYQNNSGTFASLFVRPEKRNYCVIDDFSSL